MKISSFKEKGTRDPLIILALLFLIAGCTSSTQIQSSKLIEAPEQAETTETEWEEIGTQYEWAVDPIMINGKLVYWAKNGDVWSLIYDGQEIETNYEQIGQPMVIGRELVHTAKKNGKWFVVYFDKEIETPYVKIENLVDVGGKVAYEGQRNSRVFIVYDGMEVTGETISRNPTDIGGKLAYNTNERIGTSGTSIIYGGVRFGTEYTVATNPVSIRGKLAYMSFSLTEDGRKYFVVIDGVETETPYEQIEHLTEVDGKLAFAGKKGEGDWVAVHDWFEGPSYKEIDHLTEVDGKLAFAAKKSNGKRVAVHDWVEGPEYTKISAITEVKGKLAYQAEEEHYSGIYQGAFIVYDGKKIGKEYASAWFPSEIDGKLAYWAQNNSKFFIVIGDPDTAPIYTPPPPPPPPTTAPPTPPPAEYKVHEIGPDDAKVTVTEYSDYHVSWSAVARGYDEEIVTRLKSKDPSWEAPVPKFIELANEGKIRYVFKNFPIGGQNKGGELVAEAAECAGGQGKFWEYQVLLFANQDEWKESERSYFERYAGELGLDVSSFNECLRNGDYEGVVYDDYQEGIKNGAKGVPAFTINDVAVQGVYSFSIYEEKINAALEEE